MPAPISKEVIGDLAAAFACKRKDESAKVVAEEA
jgi:hypothetical protein